MSTSSMVIHKMVQRGIIPSENFKLASDELDKEVKRRSLLIARLLAKMSMSAMKVA